MMGFKLYVYYDEGENCDGNSVVYDNDDWTRMLMAGEGIFLVEELLFQEDN